MEFIGDPAILDQLYGTGPTAVDRVDNPVLRELDQAHLAFLDHATFVVVSTADHAGLTCSPRGGAAGTLASVRDGRTLWLPDVAGRIHQTVHNLMIDPRIGLLFMVAGQDEVLRIAGTARVSASAEPLAEVSRPGLSATTVIVVDVQRVRTSGTGPLKRAGLHGDRAGLPTDTDPGATPPPSLVIAE
ncbi:MAG: pyridoxamine 5'-phosphate oxidase family protein [Euzebya sp.]